MSEFERPDPNEPDEDPPERLTWEHYPPDPDVPDEEERPRYIPIDEGVREATSLRRMLDDYPETPEDGTPMFVPVLLAVAGTIGMLSVWQFDNGQSLSYLSYGAGVASLLFAGSFLHDARHSRRRVQQSMVEQAEWGPEVRRHVLQLVGISGFTDSPHVLHRWAVLLEDVSDFALDEGEHETAELAAYGRALILDRIPPLQAMREYLQ